MIISQKYLMKGQQVHLINTAKIINQCMNRVLFHCYDERLVDKSI